MKVFTLTIVALLSSLGKLGLAQDGLSLASACDNCVSCSGDGTLWNLPFQELPFFMVLVSVGILLLVKRNKGKILFWTLGLTLFLFISIGLGNAQLKEEKHEALSSEQVTDDNAEMVFFDEENAVDFDNELLDDDELVSFRSDQVSSNEEFSEFEEFAEFDEFSSFEESTEGAENKLGWSKIFRVLMALLATIVAGILVRYKWGRKYKAVILLSSLVYLGFYSGGCPCMISSFQNLILFLLGEPTPFINLIWILGLIVLTYFFGKVWCGWICHLGALQEFLYRPKITKKLSKPGAQQVLKNIRIAVLVALLVQLVLTRSNLFIKIDPFKVAFNLFSTNITGYLLLLVLLISSLFVHRPFCKTICPVGLILGWVSKIPGASRLMVEPSCKKCNKCVRKCNYQAIDNQPAVLVNNVECIRCGDCLDSCNDIVFSDTFNRVGKNKQTILEVSEMGLASKKGNKINKGK